MSGLRVPETHSPPLPQPRDAMRTERRPRRTAHCPALRHGPTVRLQADLRSAAVRGQATSDCSTRAGRSHVAGEAEGNRNPRAPSRHERLALISVRRTGDGPPNKAHAAFRTAGRCTSAHLRPDSAAPGHFPPTSAFPREPDTIPPEESNRQQTAATKVTETSDATSNALKACRLEPPPPPNSLENLPPTA